jgi:hypothetical protein
MANLARVRCVWSGTSVIGPGVSTFYVKEAASGFPADIVTFFEAIKGAIPNTTVINVPDAGDLIDIDTGEISGTWSDFTGANVIGTGPTGWVEGVGARITWKTAGIRNGRRVVGSTFIVPLDVSQYDSAGRLDTALVNLFTAEGNDLVSDLADSMVIYSRPQGIQAGQASDVLVAVCPDSVSWLRSRRT